MAEAHASLCFALWACSLDLTAGERELQLAIKLNPHCASAHQWLGLWHACQGRHEQALESIKHALGLDPLSPVLMACLAACYLHGRSYKKAIEALRNVEASTPENSFLYEIRAWCYLKLGEIHEAEVNARRAVELSGNAPLSLCALAHALAAAGDLDGAGNLRRELEQHAKARYVPPYFTSLMHVALGERKEAIECLERGLRQKDWWVS